MNGAETKMMLSSKARVAQRLVAACAIAAAVGGGLRLVAAPAENVRLVGVSSQTAGRTAAVLIESTEPVAYSVSRPDPLTVLVDMRNVTIGSAGAKVARTAPLAGVTLEQATAIDGQALARVRVALSGPAAYQVHSARNVIRLDLDPRAAAPEPRSAALHRHPAAPGPSAAALDRSAFALDPKAGAPDVTPSRPIDAIAPDATAAAARLPDVDESTTVTASTRDGARDPEARDDRAAPRATRIERVRATHTDASAIVTLTGNGRLSPSALTESDDQPRRLVLDFPNVTPAAAARTVVDSAFVKQVRVAVNSRAPLVTRVVMDITPATTYHVERTGPDGRDITLVFEGPKAGGALLIAPSTDGAARAPGKDDEDTIPLAQALANAAPLMPRDPILALGEPSAASGTRPPQTGTPAGLPSARASHASGQPPTQAQPPTPPPAPPGGQTPPTPPPAAQGTFTADVPGSGQRQYVGAPVNFDFEDADLRSVLRLFSQFSGLNMIIDPAVQGRVNILLNDVPWDQALEQILRSNKLGYTVDGNIMRIAPIGVLADEQAQTQKLNEAKALAGELQVKTFPLSYAKADAMAPLLTRSALSARGQIQVDTRTNTLILMDLPDRLQTAQGLIATLDKPQPQVEVEARVVQTNRDFARAIGIQWGFNGRANQAIGNTTGLAFPNNGSIGGRVGANAPNSGFTQGPTDPRGGTSGDNTASVVNLAASGATSAIGLALGSINGAFNLDLQLTALENSGKGRILSEPRLATQNNQTAVVRQGVQIPVQTVANNTVSTTFVNADLSLTVTPQITASNTVIMNLTLTNSSPDFTKSVNGTPPINTQSASTTVQVNDGATAVIGGIFVSQEQTNNDRTPGVYRVPLLKWLFMRNSLTDSSRELLIFITPRILRG